MRVETLADLPQGRRFDFVVVGSGFGGAVAALRLAQKGYDVAVLESGRHFQDDEFPRTNWDLARYLWAPKLGWRGLQRLTLLDDLLVLSGAGVGGGSLVYANTLLEPGEGFYGSPQARRLDAGLRERLRPHFAAARRMLGAAPVPRLFAADDALRETARALGREETFHRVDAAVFFGEPGRAVGDPYFGGAGPERAGCTFCGACMTGCRRNAKNTLAKNYLHLAAGRGARIFSLARVRALRERGGARGGFSLTVSSPGWGLGERELEASRVVVSAGVLGTLRLLLEPATRLPRLSARLGADVRTNSEVLLGATTRGQATDYSQGLAIDAGMRPDEQTQVEAVRYGAGSDAMSLLAWPPAWPFGWAKRSTILLFMQAADSRLRLSLRRGRLRSRPEPGSAPVPRAIPSAERAARAFARAVGGRVQASTATSLLGLSTTAHILGGAAMAPSPELGVVGLDGRAHGYDDLWILDGSIVPGNLGVNPSLTIAALAEHAMSLVPPREAARP